MSFGTLGLMDAIEKFDIYKGIKFETYATLRVRGAIIDEIRKQDWIPRSTRKQVKTIEESYYMLELQLGRIATDQDVAEYLQMSVDELKKILDEAYTFNVLSFEEMIRDTQLKESLAQKNYKDPEADFQDHEMREYLRDMLEKLPVKEKLVVTLYYFEELTLKEIGKILEVSESRISQIHSKALTRLKGKLRAYVI